MKKKSLCLRFRLLAGVALILVISATGIRLSGVDAAFLEPVSEINAAGDAAVDAQFAEADALQKMTYKVKRSAETIELGGNLRRFTSVPVIELEHRETGAKGIYRLIADPEGLYVSGEISDTRLNNHFLEDLWMDDSIELMIDADANKGSQMTARDFKFIVNLLNAHFASEAGTATKALVYESLVKTEGTLNDNTDVDKGYRVEVKLPWKTLGLSQAPAAGKVFGFELGLNDSIYKGWARWYRQRYWSNADGGSANNPSGYGAIIFTEEPALVSPTLIFTQNAVNIPKGGSVKLTWAAMNAGYCTASGDWSGDMPVSGTETISNITKDATFTLSCGGLGGKTSKSLSVRSVLPDDPVPQFSIDKMVSGDGDDFGEHIDLTAGSTAYYKVTIKNTGQLPGNAVLKDRLLEPTNGGQLGGVTGLMVACPDAAQCTGSLADAGGVTINGLLAGGTAVVTYKRSVSATGISTGSSSFIVDVAYLENDLGASTSSVKVRASYPVIEEAVCPGADLVVPVELSVSGEGCGETSQPEASSEITLPAGGKYEVSAYALRGEPGSCNRQTNESFQISLNGQPGPVAKDDPDECMISARNQLLGSYTLRSGKNSVAMRTASQCPPDDSTNSVKITHLCLKRTPLEYELASVAQPFPLDGQKKEYEIAEWINITDTVRGYEATGRLISAPDGLRVLVSVNDPEMRSQQQTRDKDLAQDDHLTVMLDMLDNRGSKPDGNDYAFRVNLLNAKSDSKGQDSAWNGRFDTVVRSVGSLNEPGNIDFNYEVEMFIPWQTIGLAGEPERGTRLGFELMLNDASSSAEPHSYVWSNANGGALDDPDGWGRLRFVGMAIDPLPHLTIETDASAVRPGSAVEVSWQTTNATRCLAYGDWQGEKALSGSESIASLSAGKVFTLSCSNEYGTVTKSAFVTVSNDAPVFTFELSASAVRPDGTADLSWNAERFSSCTAFGDWSGNKALLGTETVKGITSVKSYGLRCAGPSGSVSKTVKLKVLDNAPNLAFWSSSAVVTKGGSVVLRWQADQATKCLASGDLSGEKPLSGSEEISNITSSKIFVLTCSGEAGQVRRQIKVELSATAPSLEFTADQRDLAKGQPVKLSWQSTNAVTCVASGDWNGTKAIKGNENIQNITTSKRFVLSCAGPVIWEGTKGRVETVTKVVEVNLSQQKPEITFASNRSVIKPGANIELSWNAKFADTCTASGDWTGTKKVFGTETISKLTTPKTFVLTCKGAGGESSQKVTVLIGPIVPSPSASPAPELNCHLIGNSESAKVPSGFAYPWDVFSAGKELLIKVVCKADAIEAELGNGKDSFYLWRQGFMTKDGKAWQIVNFSGSKTTADDSWLIGKGRLKEPFSSEHLLTTNYLVAFNCAYENKGWRCGCREANTCTAAGKWTFQAFQLAPGMPGEPPLIE